MYIFLNSAEAGHLYFILNPKYKTSTTMRVISGVKTLSTTAVQDFVKKDEINVYSLSDLPTNQNFRFDMSFHHTFKQSSPTKAIISITGESNGNHQVIRSVTLQFSPMTKNYDISFAVPKIDSSEYKNIQLEITTSSNILFTEFVFQNSERIEVEAIEYSYFDLKKGEKLDYLLVQEPKAE